jgi:hypothetical protein
MCSRPSLAGQHLDDGAEVEDLEHGAFVDAADLDLGGDVLDASSWRTLSRAARRSAAIVIGAVVLDVDLRAGCLR